MKKTNILLLAATFVFVTPVIVPVTGANAASWSVWAKSGSRYKYYPYGGGTVLQVRQAAKRNGLNVVAVYRGRCKPFRTPSGKMIKGRGC
jgi:hypothetical protein